MSNLTSYTRSARWSMVLGVFLIVLGLAAIGAPFVAGVTVTVLLGWLVLLAGITHLSYAWAEREVRVHPWQLLIGIAYLAAGCYLILHPLGGIVALTFVLAIYIAVEGVLELVAFSWVRPSGAAAFFLMDGIVSILLSGLIFLHWPTGSKWVLGTFAGVSILMSGIVRLMGPSRQRRLSAVPQQLANSMERVAGFAVAHCAGNSFTFGDGVDPIDKRQR